jgi:UDP-N-acetylglucosamine/UDP-N-acetylgalactosamine diphosphorylase
MVDAFSLAETLNQYDQEHLVQGIDQLDDSDREAYLQRLSQVNWQELQEPAEAVSIKDVSPSRVVTLGERKERRDELRATGEKALQSGKVAVLMVAGGQGTRLGFSGPKGCFEIGAHSGKSIYQLQAEKVLSMSRRVGKSIPFLVMTSPMTDAESRDYFAVNDNFGLEKDQVRFFSQGTVPSIDESGKVLLAGPGQLLENPDGHGGCHTALVSSGRLAELQKEGITHIVYIQVDNILAPVDDPELIGLAIVEKADVITKVLEKAHPDEKVGHLVRVDGRDRIVEYTEVTPEQTREKGADGELIYRWGSPAMHCWSVDFFGRLADQGFTLPLHRSKKPLKAWDGSKTQEVLGWKNERFIFDLVPAAEISLGLEIDRIAEFAPVKNAEGSDSPETTRQIASDYYTRWLESAGVGTHIAAGHLIEISPLFAATEEQFIANWDKRCDNISGDYYLECDF